LLVIKSLNNLFEYTPELFQNFSFAFTAYNITGAANLEPAGYTAAPVW